MWAIVIAVPLFMGLLLFVLDRLESRLVAPIQRADKIAKLLNEAPTEEVEIEVSRMLDPVLKPKRPVPS